jgi:hypothetical protein
MRLVMNKWMDVMTVDHFHNGKNIESETIKRGKPCMATGIFTVDTRQLSNPEIVSVYMHCRNVSSILPPSFWRQRNYRMICVTCKQSLCS